MVQKDDPKTSLAPKAPGKFRSLLIEQKRKSNMLGDRSSHRRATVETIAQSEHRRSMVKDRLNESLASFDDFDDFDDFGGDDFEIPIPFKTTVTQNVEDKQNQQNVKSKKSKKKNGKKEKRSIHNTPNFLSSKEQRKKNKQKKTNKQKKETPPETLNNVRAPILKLDLKTFTPKNLPKTIDEHQTLSTAMEDSILLSSNNKAQGKLEAAMEQVNLKPGEILSSQGEVHEKDDRYYVVHQGEVEFQVDGVTVERAEAGAAFGEDRLLYRFENQATVKAMKDTKLFRIDQQTYKGVMQQEEEKKLAKHKSSKKRPTSKPAKRIRNRTIAGEWDLSDSPILQKQQAIRKAIDKEAPSKSDLEVIDVLGEGQFGEVWLVSATLKQPDEKNCFALKLQSTYNPEHKIDNVPAIRQEIHTMQSIYHPFMANLVHVYESKDSIDMLLGLIEGKELWDDVNRRGDGDKGTWTLGFSEERAKFYTTVLVDVLAYLHKKEFVFRDLKLENVMIGENDGYPILIDFGFAKQVPDGEKTFTFCGTPNYMAPEVIRATGHDRTADYWSLGVVIYEMVSGDNPFFYEGVDQLTLYESIVEDPPYELEGPKYSTDVIDLCNKLLEKDPSTRLGSGHPHDILEHAWFQGLPDLSLYRAKRVKPPLLFPGEDNADNEDDKDAKDVEDDVLEAAGTKSSLPKVLDGSRHVPDDDRPDLDKRNASQEIMRRYGLRKSGMRGCRVKNL